MFENFAPWRYVVSIGLLIILFCSTATLAKKPLPPDDPPEEPTPAYTVVDLLGIPGGDFLQSRGQSISQADDSGTVFVAGLSYAAEQWHPVLWAVGAGGSFTNPLDLDPRGYQYNDVSVNNAGVVVERWGYVYQPFVPGLEMQDLDTEDFEAQTTAINNSDEIAGWIVYDNGETRWGSGALWILDANGVPGDPILLGDGDFIPEDISDTGLMVGEELGNPMAVIAQLEGNELQVTSLGVLPGYDCSQANAISSNGVWVAGTCKKLGVNDEGQTILLGKEAFVWSETTGMIGLGRLGDPGSEALGVNNTGQVIGYSDTNDRYSQTAFLWQPGSLAPRDGQMFDLNALADTGKNHLCVALDINDAGQIVGEMYLPRPVSEYHGFMLIPSDE